jgi:hypothetical protein
MQFTLKIANKETLAASMPGKCQFMEYIKDPADMELSFG